MARAYFDERTGEKKARTIKDFELADIAIDGGDPSVRTKNWGTNFSSSSKRLVETLTESRANFVKEPNGANVDAPHEVLKVVPRARNLALASARFVAVFDSCVRL